MRAGAFWRAGKLPFYDMPILPAANLLGHFGALSATGRAKCDDGGDYYIRRGDFWKAAHLQQLLINICIPEYRRPLPHADDNIDDFHTYFSIIDYY